MKSLSKLKTVIALGAASALSFVVMAQIPKGKLGQAGPSKAPTLEWVQEVFIDYGVPSHSGPPQATTESSDYHWTQGGIRWFGGAQVKYKIEGTEPLGGANNAVVVAEETWDGFITTRDFARDDGSPSLNPCGGDNTVEWAPIDGPGRVLAVTSVCRNVATKEIGGFTVMMDNAESWSPTGAADAFDVENVAAHEFGHVAGLSHVNPPRAGCLSMYWLASEGETQKRTLGWGDKLGMNILYATGDTTEGPGCGN